MYTLYVCSRWNGNPNLSILYRSGQDHSFLFEKDEGYPGQKANRRLLIAEHIWSNPFWYQLSLEQAG